MGRLRVGICVNSMGHHCEGPPDLQFVFIKKMGLFLKHILLIDTINKLTLVCDLNSKSNYTYSHYQTL